MPSENPGHSSFSSAQPVGEGGALRASDRLDAIHEYVQSLDRVLARAHERPADAGLRALEAVPTPTPHSEEVAHLLERKRRELRERFDLVRHQLIQVPDVALGTWLAFFFAAAEMAGSAHVSVAWHEVLPGHTLLEEVSVEDGPAYRKRIAQAGVGLEALRELTHIAPDGAHAALDAATQWLTLSGAPFTFAQVQRELDRVTHSAPLSFSLGYDLGRDIQEGMALAVRVQFRNHSNDVVVLEDLSTNHPYDPSEHFSQPSLGRLVHDAEANCFTYDSMATGVTASAFHTGVLKPGEERTAILTLRLLEGGDCWREFNLSYRRFSEADFAARAYVARSAPTMSFPPHSVYGLLSDFASPRSADTTTVVLAPEHGMPCQSLRWAYPFHVGRRAFSLAQALRRLPDGSEPVHFSRWQQAWVLRTSGGCALVSPSRVTLYPRLDPAVFILIDDTEQRVPLRLDEPVLAVFRSLPLGITDWESHALGLSVSLPKLKLTSFFQEVERLGCALEVTENLLGRRSLWVTA